MKIIQQSTQWWEEILCSH